jgi:hypothetical protein
MKKWKKLFLILSMLGCASPGYSVLKQHYGGNTKIAEDLTPGLTQIRLFENRADKISTPYPVPFLIQENTLRADLSFLPDDRITELENAIQDLQNPSSPCHWILDYPFFKHEHGNSVQIEKKTLIVKASEPEFLNSLVESACLIPGRLSFLLPFLKTQFGYEANQSCIAGRPFLDSISPVAIDPVNPYLAFKLNEVDAFVVPEEKFRQISGDDQIDLIPGPEFYLYLKSENLSPEKVKDLTSVLDISEAARTVLNDHAEIFLTAKAVRAANWKTPVYFKIPEEIPFRLVGERLKIQLENAGFVISTKALPKNSPTLELAVWIMNESDTDVFRYRLLREEWNLSTDTTSFEEWDELEASGKIVPLLLYQSRVAVRKNLLDVRSGTGGMPDFSNAWILPAP